MKIIKEIANTIINNMKKDNAKISELNNYIEELIEKDTRFHENLRKDVEKEVFKILGKK